MGDKSEGKSVDLYNTTILADIPFKQMMETENLDPKDSRLTYESFWTKTDFSIKKKRGSSMMHSSAWRPLMPKSKKDAKMLECKLQVMFGTGKRATMENEAKMYHTTPLLEVTLDDAAAYGMSAAAAALAALNLF